MLEILFEVSNSLEVRIPDSRPIDLHLFSGGVLRKWVAGD